MSTDRRRITGPANALPLVFAPVAEDSGHAQSLKPDDAIRNFFVKTNIVDNANGSCYLEIDNSTIIVSVYGPKPIRGSSISSASFTVSSKVSPNVNDLANFKSFKSTSLVKEEEDDDEDAQETNGDYVTTGAIGKTQLSSLEQRLSTYIQSAFLPSILLQKYPKSTIEVYVNILTNDPNTNNSLLSLITWCSNCTSLALVNAGIELQDIVSTGSSRLVLDRQALVIDPLYSDNAGDAAINAVVSYMNTSDTIVGLLLDSEEEVDEKLLGRLLAGCNTMSKQIRGNINGYLMSSV